MIGAITGMSQVPLYEPIKVVKEATEGAPQIFSICQGHGQQDVACPRLSLHEAFACGRLKN
eukprot:927422-Heterocapsa_arctica.AAC.1